MEVSSIAVDESVSTVFPPEQLRDALTDVVDVAIIDADADSLEPYDAVVTMAYHDSYLQGVHWIHSIQAGVDRFPFDEVRKHGVLLTNSSGIHGPAVGETVAGYMLSFARRLLPAVKADPAGVVATRMGRRIYAGRRALLYRRVRDARSGNRGAGVSARTRCRRRPSLG